MPEFETVLHPDWVIPIALEDRCSRHTAWA